jgi:S1-C subfamily serine protease
MSLSMVLKLFVACVVVSGLSEVTAVASPVVDDKQLAKALVEGLGRLADACTEASPTTLTSDVMKAKLAHAEGRQATLPAAQVRGAAANERDIYDGTMPSVVVIGTVFKCGKCTDWHPSGMATGWIASEDGIVVTNYHVLAKTGGHFFGVMTADGTVYGVADVLGADRAGDVAVIRVDTRGDRLPSLPLGDDPQCGDKVSLIGHPAGRFFTFSTGAVSRFYKDDGVPKPPVVVANEDGGQPDETHAPGDDPSVESTKDAAPTEEIPDPAARRRVIWMSVTADFAIGNSGGHVVDAHGNVVGMVSRIVMTVTGTRLARPQPGGRSTPVPPPHQIAFKDCVSLDTLRRVLAIPKP